MKYILILTTFFTTLFADFEIKYLIDSRFVQTSYYKDDKHVLFNIKEHNKTLEDLIILDSKKYIRFNDSGIEHLYEIEEDSEDIDNNKTIQEKADYSIVKKIKNLNYLDFKAEVWKIKHKNSKIEYIIVTDNKELLKNLKLSLNAIKKLLPPNKQDSASMFIINNKYVILQTDNLIFKKYKKSEIKLSLFHINKSLNKQEQLELSKNIEQCFHSVCCGDNNITKAKYLNSFLKMDSKNWRVQKIAKCESNTQKNLESAIYINNDRFVTVELVANGNLKDGKIASLTKEGLDISNIKKSSIDGFKATSAYLPIVDASILDIELPNTTISLYTKGKFDLIDFSKKNLILRKRLNYTFSN